MSRHRWIFALAAASLTTVSAGSGFSQEPAGEGAEIEKQLAEARAEANKVAAEYNAIINKARQDEELKKLDAQVEAAARAVREAENNDEALAAARRIEAEALAKIRQEVETKLAELAEAKPLLAKVEELQAKIDEHTYEIALARFQLEHEASPVNRALAKDAELAELKARAETATGAERKTALAAHRELLAKKRAELEIAKPLLERIKEQEAKLAPLAKEVSDVRAELKKLRSRVEAEARPALEEARKAAREALNSDKLKELQAAHAAAIKEYNQKAKELLETEPMVAELKKKYQDLAAKVRALQKKLDGMK